MTFWKRQNRGEKADQWLPGSEVAGRVDYKGHGGILEAEKIILCLVYNGRFMAVCVRCHS